MKSKIRSRSFLRTFFSLARPAPAAHRPVRSTRSIHTNVVNAALWLGFQAVGTGGVIRGWSGTRHSAPASWPHPPPSSTFEFPACVENTFEKAFVCFLCEPFSLSLSLSRPLLPLSLALPITSLPIIFPALSCTEGICATAANIAYSSIIPAVSNSRPANGQDAAIASSPGVSSVPPHPRRLALIRGVIRGFMSGEW